MAQPPNNLPIEPKPGNSALPPMKPTVPSAPQETPVAKPPIAPPPSTSKPLQIPNPSSGANKPPEIKAMPKNQPAPISKQKSKVGEPEDIFAGIEPVRRGLGSKKSTEAPLGPKKKGGAGKVIVVLFITLLVLGVLGFAFWFFVLRGMNKTSDPTAIQDSGSIQNTDTKKSQATTPPPIPPPLNQPSEGLQIPAKSTGTNSVNEQATTSSPSGTKVPPPTPITGEPPASSGVTSTTSSTSSTKDTDKDGLTDAREISLGLKVDNPDSDGDGLTDGDEVDIYGTNPLNPDTDGDGYTDGNEVEKGYDPRGPGKCAKTDCTQ